MLVSHYLFANEKLGKIIDADGYTNVRDKPSTKSNILFKIETNEYFYYENSDSKDWCKVTNMNGESGFMHKSRIIDVTEFVIKGKSYQSKESKLKIRKKKIGDNLITIYQIKNEKSECYAYVDVNNINTKTTCFPYELVESLGGNAGIAFLENIVPNHILIVKHGDYDGRTIFVSKNGNVKEVSGGSVSKLIEGKYLINFVACDIGYCGFSIYDIQKEVIVFDYESEFELYELKDEFVFDLDFGDGVDYNSFDFDKLQFKKIEVNLNLNDNYARKLMQYELKNGCLCF